MGARFHQIPPTGYDAMKVCVPALQTVVPRSAQEIRRGDWDETKTIPQDDLADVEEVEFFLKEYAIAKAYSGWSREAAIWDANMLGAHLFYMINFELHRRKAFWVDESLAWMLSQTRLDIDGECLKLPFPACAFLYSDRATLEVAEEILRNEEDALIKGERLKIISVYLVQGPGEGDATGLSVNCLFDSQTGKWPYMLSRDLLIGPRDNLDTILDSHFSGIDVENLDGVFSSPSFKRLVHLVINSILYATSSHLETLVLRAPFKSVKRGAKRREEKDRAKAERVHH